jgi:hypothetical protein
VLPLGNFALEAHALVRADFSQRFPAAFCEQTGKSPLPLLNVSFISSKLLKFGDERIACALGSAREVQKPLKDPSDFLEEDFPQPLQNSTGRSLSRTL